MKPVILIVVGCLMASLLVLARAQEPVTPSTEDYLTELQKHLKSVKTVQADFEQEKKLAIFNRTMMIRGEMALDRPKRMMWHVREPVRYSILMEGDTVRQWDEDTDRVQTLHLGDKPTLKAVFSQFRAWFLGDYQAIAQAYDVVIVDREPPCLRFSPKPESAMAEMVKQVRMTISKDRLSIETIVIEEKGDDTTTIRFLNTRLNQPIQEEVWEIPPHGR